MQSLILAIDPPEGSHTTLEYLYTTVSAAQNVRFKVDSMAGINKSEKEPKLFSKTFPTVVS